MIPDKPFTTIDEQIRLISSRNVSIKNDFFTRESLSSISYYTLMNGYKNTFLAGERDNFVDGTTFEMIYTCHWLDISLSNIILKYILLIEKSLKTKLSYVVAQEFGVIQSQYLDFRNYSNPKSSRNGILNDIKDVLRNPKEDSVICYYKNEKNHVPPWILVNDLMFGLTLRWYSILKSNQKVFICLEIFKNYQNNLTIEQQKEFLRKSLYMLKDFRNKVAHGSRTLNISLNDELPSIPLFKIVNENILTQNEYRNNLGKNDLFSIMLIIVALLNDDFQLRNFFNEIEQFLFPYIEQGPIFNGKNIYELFSLPEDFIARLKSFYRLKISEKPI